MMAGLGTCVNLDPEVMRKIHQTPRAPTKTGAHSPLKSSHKRSLFQPEQNSDSEGIGGMSPFSTSSEASDDPSLYSPIGSPGGIFATPNKSPKSQTYGETQIVRRSPRAKIEVKSFLFPHIKSYTPKSVKNTRLKSESKKFDSAKNMSTPSPTGQNHVVPETPSTVSMTPSKRKPSQNNRTSNKKEKSKFSVISPENFYGENKPRARISLFSETKDPDVNKGIEEQPKKRLSNSDVTKNRTTSNKRVKYGKRKGQKLPNNGVWHGVKRPSKLKKKQHLDRIEKEMKQERKRKLKHIQKSESSDNEGDIIDSFPDTLIKRKKLSTVGSRTNQSSPPFTTTTPDPNKKFFKHGRLNSATYSLYDKNNKVVNISASGQFKLQSPKKKNMMKKNRRLFTPTKQYDIEFNEDFTAGTTPDDAVVQQSIENILRDLTDEQAPPKITKLDNVTDEELFHIMDNNPCQVKLVQLSPDKVLTELQNNSPTKKLLNNMSSLVLDEVQNNEKDGVKCVLEETSKIIAQTNEILDGTPDENSTPNKQNQFYDLFYKDNWKKSPGQELQNVKTSGKKKTTRIVPDDQYLLDAGQTSVGIIECQQCGVMYQAGDFADEAIHRNFHNHVADLRFTGWSNERVVGKYPDGRVVMVLSIDSKHWWKKVFKVIEIIDQELGFPETVLDSLLYKTVYLYISEKNKQIVGCLVGEQCRQAYRMYPPVGGVDSDLCSDVPTPCKIGVSRIWTALTHRRNGVATRLVECLQKTFLYGEIIPIEQIAFTVPSPPGKLFAQKVTGRHDILVYGMGMDL